MSKTIVKAAIKIKDEIIVGYDHGECFSRANFPILTQDLEQGFIDSNGNFVDRKQAMIIAKEAGQLRYTPHKETLISEDLHLDWLNKQASKINELEKTNKRLKKNWELSRCQQRRLYNNLKQQLSERENEIKTLICDYESRITKEQELMSWLEHNNEELKQQLAEKEKEIEKQQVVLDKVITELHTNCYSGLNIVHFKEMMLNDLGGVEIKHNQDKISFAVKKIQELKKNLRGKVCLMENNEHCYPQNAIHWQDVVALIEKQIEELKSK